MFATVVLLQLLCSNALGQGGVPTFTWITETENRVENGLRFQKLKMSYPDQTSDVIDFYNIQEYDGEEDNEKFCIMKGILDNRPEVHVALTGGCGQTKDFEITIAGCDKLSYAMFNVTQGQVEPILSSLDHVIVKDEPTDAATEEVEKVATSRASWNKTKLGAKQLDMEWYYDAAFDKYVTPLKSVKKGDVAVLSIAAHAQAWLLHSSLPYDIRLQHNSIKKLNGQTLYPDQNTLNEIQRRHSWTSNNNQAAIYVGMTSPAYTYGNSFKSTICTDRSNAVGIVLHYRTLAGTGQSAAVYLAYLLGIKNDYNRIDGDDDSCVNSEFMMYGSTNVNRWSGCSSFDLQLRFSRGQLSCLSDYQCHDQSDCSVNTKDDCVINPKIFEMSCPKMCGICT